LHADIAATAAPSSLRHVMDDLPSALAVDAVPRELAERARQVVERLEDGTNLLHGDLHPGNVLMDPKGPWGRASLRSAAHSSRPQARGTPRADATRARTPFSYTQAEPPVIRADAMSEPRSPARWDNARNEPIGGTRYRPKPHTKILPVPTGRAAARI
jgi:hypothetical protein